MTPDLKKKQRRLQALNHIKQLDDQSKQLRSKALLKVFFEYFYKSSNAFESVAVYANDPTEISIDAISSELLNRGVKLAFPHVKGPNMNFYEVKSLKDLTVGKYGIRQPKASNDKKIDVFDLMLIPGRVFDIFGNRIGRGAGHYDKFLMTNRNIYKLGIAFDCQISNTLIDFEDHDAKMNAVISEEKLHLIDEKTVE